MSHVSREQPVRRSAGLFRSEQGAVAVEYALLTALIAGAIVATLSVLGSSLNGTFSYVSSAIDVAQGGSADSGGSGPNGHGNGNGKGGNGKGNNGNGNGNGGPNQDP